MRTANVMTGKPSGNASDIGTLYCLAQRRRSLLIHLSLSGLIVRDSGYGMLREGGVGEEGCWTIILLMLRGGMLPQALMTAPRRTGMYVIWQSWKTGHVCRFEGGLLE